MTKTFFYTIILLTIVFSTAIISCEESQTAWNQETAEQAIIDGERTYYQEWKGAVGLYGVHSSCSGVLIHPRVVLSAAHCVFLDAGAQSIDYVNNPMDLRVNGGDHFVLTPDEISFVDEAVTHPDWPGDVYTGYEPDLSLILLTEEAVGIPTYPLHSGPNPPVDSPGVIVGYGLGTAHDTTTTGYHRKGDTNLLTFEFNAIEIGGLTGSCSGDSGGPLFVQQGGEWKILGIDSYVEGTNYDCPVESGSWYINVIDYREWIAQTVYDWTGDILDNIDLDTDTTPVDTDVDTDTDTGPVGGGGGPPMGGGGDDVNDLEPLETDAPFGVPATSSCSTTPGSTGGAGSSWIVALLAVSFVIRKFKLTP